MLDKTAISTEVDRAAWDRSPPIVPGPSNSWDKEPVNSLNSKHGRTWQAARLFDVE